MSKAYNAWEKEFPKATEKEKATVKSLYGDSDAAEKVETPVVKTDAK